ncbi:MAG: AsmA family protein [Gammaproteobacteria bacterium]
MTKLLKIIVAVVGLAVILMVAAAIMIPMFVNPNDFKGEIIRQVEHTTGRKLELAGDIGLTVFPWLGLELGATTLGNAPGFGGQPFLRSERVQVRVKLLPLLQQQVEMDTVTIEGLELNLARDKSGKSNWDDLLEKGAPAQATPQAEAPAAKPDAAGEATPPVVALAFGGVDLKGGRITWDDRQQGERYAIEDLNLETGAIVPGEPVPLDLSLTFDAGSLGLAGNLVLGGTADYDLESRRYGVKSFDFTAKLTGKSVPGGALDVNFTAEHVNADLKQNAATLSGLALDAGGASLSGDIQVQNLASGKPAVTYTLNAKGREVSGLIKAAGEAFNIAGIPKSLTALSIDMGMSGTAAKVAVKPLKFQAALQAAGAKGPLTLDLQSERVDFDLTSKAVAVKSGALKITGDDVVPALKEFGMSNPGLEELAIGLNMDTEFSGTGTKLTLAPFNVKAALASDTLPNKSAEVTLATRAEIDLDKQTAAFNDLALRGLGLDLRGAVQAENIQKDPKFGGTLKLQPFDARKLLTQLGQAVPETADPKAFRNVGFESAFAGSKNSINLSDLALRLDDTQIRGTLSVADFSRPAIGFKLDADGIDADRYMPPEKAKKGGVGDPQKSDKPRAKKARGDRDAGSATDDAAPVGATGALNLKGVLTVGKLKIANATLTQLSVAVNAKDGDIHLNPIAADLYQGKIAGSVGLNTRAAQPKLSMNESLTGVQIEPLLKDLSGEAKIAGTADLKMKISAAGASADAIKRTLSGKAAFQVLDGALIGVNLGQLMRKAQAGFAGKVDENAKTDFSEMAGTLIFDQGVVSNQDLVLKSPLLRVAGKGQANLVSERIDYTLNTTLSATAEGQGGKDLTDLRGITIPIKVSGTFDDPRYAPDVAGLAKAKAEKALEKNKAKITEKLKDLLRF